MRADAEAYNYRPCDRGSSERCGTCDGTDRADMFCPLQNSPVRVWCVCDHFFCAAHQPNPTNSHRRPGIRLLAASKE